MKLETSSIFLLVLTLFSSWRVVKAGYPDQEDGELNIKLQNVSDETKGRDPSLNDEEIHLLVKWENWQVGLVGHFPLT